MNEDERIFGEDESRCLRNDCNNYITRIFFNPVIFPRDRFAVDSRFADIRAREIRGRSSHPLHVAVPFGFLYGRTAEEVHHTTMPDRNYVYTVRG